ncbi:alpha/beta fold hydrolase, partial [Mycobacterium sp.]|uniref:alpha/beta fold hydrolase n=1 Tax=Mycobacterium sp. TaxID=1785 RepID=UPI003C780E9D
MTMNAKRRRVQDKLARLPGVRPVRRPISPDRRHHLIAGDADEFDLYYVRTGRKSAHPLVIIPGGPGMASVQMYKGLRRRAAAAGLDVIMIEHRGVGMSRHDDSGADLPPEALTVNQVVDDVAAVLDDAQVESAVIYGTSYGTYVAAGVGVRHPGRVRAMILDSPLLSRDDIAIVRDAIRGLLLKGDSPETAALAPKVRKLVDAGVMTAAAGELTAEVYGYGGAALLDRQLDLLLDGRT